MNAAGPILVILAAGLGRRFGGDKQLAGLGPGGEWLIEYAIHDALAAGFTRIVLVIRAELRGALAQRLAPHIGSRADIAFVEQTLSCVPAGCRPSAARRKPLGTGHALWCCRDVLDRPFAVINADDYYGAAAFSLLAGHFVRAHGPAMVGYRLGRTLSAHGGVNRGLCALDDRGDLAGIVEYTDIRVDAGRLGGLDVRNARQPLAAEAIVSLNCWGLLPDLLPTLETGLRDFLAGAGDDDEYFLPAAIDRYLAANGRRLRVLDSRDDWLGVTYPADADAVAARLAALHAVGRYPPHLWG
ncbi:NTP transferase domain-containing protein [Dokdonella soli]|uniref:Nucleotidyltransferase n=1 Tax=Dokdonella soli TaxID=529810 RepID=A0ABN1IHG5_9GAMM